MRKFLEPGAVFLLQKGLVIPKNTSGVTQVFYDSNRNPIVYKPGDPMYHMLQTKFKLPEFFVSADLWEAQRKLERMREEWGKPTGPFSLAFRNTAPGIGDAIMSTVLPKAFKEAFGNDVKIVYFTTPELASVLEQNPNIDFVRFDDGYEKETFDLKMDLADFEFKMETKVSELGQLHKRNRTAIWLSELGIWLVDKTPVYVVSEEEKAWAKQEVAHLPRPLVGIQLTASCMSRTYPKMSEVAKLASAAGYGVVVLDERVGGEYKYNLRQLGALINNCDVVVAPDSAALHIAGALRKRIVGVFGHTDGSIFCEDYEKASVVQGACLHGRKDPCWWKIECNPGQTTKEKSRLAHVPCLHSVPPELVMAQVEDHLKTPKRILVTMLTYNNLEMTRKALSSIKSWHSYDVFIVDNASTDGTPEWLAAHGYEFVSKKCGVGEAQNIALQKLLDEGHDHLLLLNNDIVLRCDYVDEIVNDIEKTKAWAIAGTAFSKTPPWMVDESTEMEKGHFSKVADIIAGDFSATIISRECIEKVGIFDDGFAPRYIEDNDYILRIRIEGGEFLRTTNAQYYHVLGAVIHTQEIEKLQHNARWLTNLEKFQTKWGFSPHEQQSFSKLGLEWRKKVTGRTPLQEIELLVAVRDQSRPVTVLVRRAMGGLGDILFTTVVGRELKRRLGSQIDVSYAVPESFVSVLAKLPFITRVLDVQSASQARFDYKIDLTDLEFRCELHEIALHNEVLRSRTQIYLDAVGLEGCITPSYTIDENEIAEGEAFWSKLGSGPRIVVVPKGSNLLKVWPGMQELITRLRSLSDPVCRVLELVEGVWSIRQVGAILATANIVIAPDTGVSNLAATLGKKTITIFSNRGGHVFRSMFGEPMLPVQGVCPYEKRGFCDFRTPCFGTAPHRRKENIDVPECMKGLTVDSVFQTVMFHLRGATHANRRTKRKTAASANRQAE